MWLAIIGAAEGFFIAAALASIAETQRQRLKVEERLHARDLADDEALTRFTRGQTP